MITTIDDNTNGFRLDLIPMAMSSSTTSSRSLLQATLALSSFHLGRPEDALKHKVQAIKALSESFQAEDSSRIAQFAACMMLCVYSVYVTFVLNRDLERTLTENRSLTLPTPHGIYTSKPRRQSHIPSPNPNEIYQACNFSNFGSNIIIHSQYTAIRRIPRRNKK